MEKPYLQKKTPILVVTFYSFTNISDISRLYSQVQTTCKKENLLGTAEISTEGINCSLAGTSSAIKRFLEKLKIGALLALVFLLQSRDEFKHPD